jgi:hypothetical protein
MAGRNLWIVLKEGKQLLSKWTGVFGLVREINYLSFSTGFSLTLGTRRALNSLNSELSYRRFAPHASAPRA